MSGLIALDKLRIVARMAKGRNLENHEECNKLLVIADEIDDEIAERYMELPVDADGVPIRVGDAIEYSNGERDVVRFITANGSVPTFNERGWVASKCRHVKPRTVEDVLRELADVARLDRAHDLDDGDIEGFAAEIRELMEVER